jgi:exosortase A
MNNSLTAHLPSPAAWRRLAPGLLLCAGVLLLFRETAVAMVTIWIRSDTFAHALVVPPITAWLVWRRRALLATLQPRPAPWVLALMTGVCLLWLLGALASVAAATQLALVALLVLSVPAVFGLAVARALLFPLLFLFFAAPVGEFMVPTMMEWTADFTVAALQLTGVPVFREGLQFIIPTGNWSVVEACSGVRYLIASFMVGTLFAYLNFRSPMRRALFMAASLLVPVLANWFRAYLIVILGHLSGNKLAAGADHLVYGWVFFGIVIGVMFMVGSRWAEPDDPDIAAAPGAGPAPSAVAVATPASTWGVVALAVALLLGTQAVYWRLDTAVDHAAPVLSLPDALGSEWQAQATPVSEWAPNFRNPRATAARSYRAGGASVALWLGYYRAQGQEHKLVSSANTLADPSAGALWVQVASGQRSVSTSGGALQVRTAELRGSPASGPLAEQRLRVWQMYWIGGRFIAGDARAKLELALNRLLGRGDDSAVVLFYAPLETGHDTDLDLERFVGASLPPLSAALEAARDAR